MKNRNNYNINFTIDIKYLNTNKILKIITIML